MTLCFLYLDVFRASRVERELLKGSRVSSYSLTESTRESIIIVLMLHQMLSMDLISLYHFQLSSCNFLGNV